MPLYPLADKRLWLQLFLLWLLLIAAPISAVEASGPYEIGLRVGVDSGRAIENYASGEVYFLKNLPWTSRLTDNLALKCRFDSGVFYLQADSEDGAMFAAGLDLVMSAFNRFEIEAGFRPTWMPDARFGVDDFGGELQFTSHAGMAFTRPPFVFNYRFQHTSNGGIYDRNPGLNLHLLGIGYRF